MYAQKAIVHYAPTLHTVRNVHNHTVPIVSEYNRVIVSIL